MTHSTRLTLFVSAICRPVKSKFSRDEIYSSPRNLIFLNISVHNCCDTPFCLCVYRCNLCISQFHLPPALPPPLPGWPPGISIFFSPLMANSRGWGLLSFQIPQGGDEKRRRMPLPPSTLQLPPYIFHRSHSRIVPFLIKHFNVRFFVSINVFLCNSARILIKTSRRDDMHQFMVLVLI